MSDQTDNLIKQLQAFGLEEEEVRVYLYLLEQGVQTALQISRAIHVGRTRVYRLLDLLYSKGLVARTHDDMGFKFAANSPKQMQFLLTEKESDLERLKKELPFLTNELASLQTISKEKSQVRYYTGREGLEQVTWNSLQSDGKIYIFEIKDMTSFMSQEFAEKMREKFAEKGIKTFQLTNIRHIKPFTNVAKHVKDWQVRYVDPKKLQMKFELLIYNDVYAIYNVKGNDVFCVEIKNSELAAMQKQLFEYIWSTAQPMKILNQHGEARVKSTKQEQQSLNH